MFVWGLGYWCGNLVLVCACVGVCVCAFGCGCVLSGCGYFCMFGCGRGCLFVCLGVMFKCGVYVCVRLGVGAGVRVCTLSVHLGVSLDACVLAHTCMFACVRVDARARADGWVDRRSVG